MKISVVLSVFNESKFINDCLISILEQSEVNVEVIVVDDYSTDNTWELVSELKDGFPNLFLFKNPSKGKVHAFNYGVSISTGEYICLFGGDDIMPQNSLFERYSAIRTYSSDQKVVGLSKIRILSTDKHINGLIIPKRNNSASYSGQSPLISRCAAELLFPIPAHLVNEDTYIELVLRFATNFIVIHSNIICCDWRRHQNNSVNTSYGYKKFRDAICKRLVAYDVLLENTVFELNKNILFLESYNLYNHFRNGNYFQLLFSKGEFTDKLRYLSMSNKHFFYLRLIMGRLAMGFS